TLSVETKLGVSAATIRNTLADLTDLGLLASPHISAGRVPTELGLRLFVDSLMQVSALSDDERRAIDAPSVEDDGSTVLEQVASRLSGLTQTAGLVVTQKIEAPLRHIEFIATSPEAALAILVYEDGRVENRLISTPPGLPAGALISAGNYLASRLRGRHIREAREEILAEIENNRAALDALTSKLVAGGVAELAGGERSSLIVRGRGRLLDEATAADLERVRLLFDDLERKQSLIELLNAARDGDGVRIFIGSENRLFSLSGSSVIVAPYRDGASKIVGVLGVIGPTRINYARVIPIVDYTAEAVSRMLK
ncbi:MAG: heat-inducible transcriptional repressor HrcA, partial [Parvularculaceae bacterium]|nr:heat-inducible transcriptional repressor HrcA [Parvularculaceae bacterium]